MFGVYDNVGILGKFPIHSCSNHGHQKVQLVVQSRRSAVLTCVDTVYRQSK